MSVDAKPGCSAAHSGGSAGAFDAGAQEESPAFATV